MRTRSQKGYIRRKGSCWLLLYWDTVLVESEGKLVSKRKLCAKKIACYPEYRSKMSVRPFADEFLEKINSGRLQPESTMRLAQFWKSTYWHYVQQQKRPSTARRYRQSWECLEPHCGTIRLRDFRCCDGERVLTEVDRHCHFSHSTYKRMRCADWET